MLALRCLNAALALDAKHPALHAQAVELRHALNSALDSLPAKVQETVKAEFTAIPATADLKKLNADFLKEHGSSSARHRVSAARAAAALGEPRAESEKSLTDALRIDSVTFNDAGEILELLRSWRSSAAADFKKAAHEKWPEVTVFCVGG